MDWKNLQHFPLSNGEWALYRDTKSQAKMGRNDILKATKRWNIFSNILCSSPSTRYFLPPILVPELENKLHDVFVFRSRMMLWIALFFLTVFIIMFSGIFFNDHINHGSIFLFLMISLHFYVENKYIVGDVTAFKERALHIRWLKSNRGFNYYSILSIVLIAGGIQFWFHNLNPDPNYIIEKYGVIYTSIDNREYWRFLIGPFFHASFQHWVLNFVCLMLFATMSTNFKRILYFILFYFSVVMSAYVAYIFTHRLGYGTANADGFVGVSGGVFFLAGLLLANSFRYIHSYPRYFSLHMLLLVAIFLILPLVADPGITSTVAHISGLCVGLFVGFLTNKNGMS